MTLFLIFGLSFLMVGCHFIGDPQAANNSPVFFAGLWDGTVAIWSIILTIFTDVGIMEPQYSSIFYKLGFAFGTLVLSWNIGLFLGIISVILYMLPF